MLMCFEVLALEDLGTVFLLRMNTVVWGRKNIGKSAGF
jgi:hypothetical protein